MTNVGDDDEFSIFHKQHLYKNELIEQKIENFTDWTTSSVQIADKKIIKRNQIVEKSENQAIQKPTHDQLWVYNFIEKTQISILYEILGNRRVFLQIFLTRLSVNSIKLVIKSAWPLNKSDFAKNSK